MENLDYLGFLRVSGFCEGFESPRKAGRSNFRPPDSIKIRACYLFADPGAPREIL
jgi:hypothetical protein